MITVILSQLLGLIRQRLLVGIFGASNILGAYLYAIKLPDTLFQLIIAGALSSAFIPIFSDFICHDREKEGHKFASNLLTLWLTVFCLLSIVLISFAGFFSHLIAPGLSGEQLVLMANLMRIVIFGQLLFIIGSFLSVILQSYNHFFVPGIALASYNLGIILGIILLHGMVGIYAPAYGTIIGSAFFILLQLPFMKSIGFSFKPSLSWKNKAVMAVFHLMWPRTISIAIYQLGLIITGILISLIGSQSRPYVIFDYAQTLAFAPISLFGYTIAQAAFPVLSKQKNDISAFKLTFITSFNQMLYLVLPVSALFVVLRIPVVRLIYGAQLFDWEATRLTGQTLALLSLSLFAQALVQLVLRAFYALHDTKTPLIVGGVTTVLMCIMQAIAVLVLHQGLVGLAISYSIASVLQLMILLMVLNKKTQGFFDRSSILATAKIFLAAFCTAFALYIPIKLLDRLVFDTTHTINLIILTGIASLIGCSLYLFLTWLLSVHEAKTYLLLFSRIGNWRDILGKTEEPIEGSRLSP